jgi:hypothetical protein
MPIIDDQRLYDRVKKRADTIYAKPSAYKSGWIVKTYKELGGTYSEDNQPKKLKQWYDAVWKSVAEKDQYPVLRPTVRVNKTTPLLPSEIDPKNLKHQIDLKQKIKGKKNLPPFRPKTT